MVEYDDWDKGFGKGSEQTFFKGEGLTTMDSDGGLSCLSQNPTLKFEAMSSLFSSSSQIIGNTSRLTPIFSSSLEDNEGEDEEEDEANDEDGKAGGRVIAFWMGQAVVVFFFWASGRIVELEDQQPTTGAYLNVIF